ncbi:hypothetical protein [Pedobacter psychrodurus]|uniref:hypothetical protein n=1 Tax=Pedobacter psychrodurus TaxID=2530456 RepID=UPI00292F4419|nr:hypothetical protein [Pedobacter psychrodurus]
MDIKQTSTANNERSKRLENGRFQKNTIPLSKLNTVIGAVELLNDFDEEIELRAYFENKHL